MADPIRTALMAARACIQQDRQALADAHTSVDGLDEDGAAGVAEYDEVLRQIDEALGALEAPVGKHDAEALRIAGLTLIGLAEHDQRCEVFDLDDEGRHKHCSCGYTYAISVITQAGKTAPDDRAMLAARPSVSQGDPATRAQWLRELLDSVMNFRPEDNGMVRGGPYIRADSLLQAAEVAAAPTVAPSQEAVLAEMREFARARLPDFLGAHHMALVLSQQINRWVDQLAARSPAPTVALTEEQRREAFAAGYAAAEADAAVCHVPPPGWSCTRQAGHEGPCAAVPNDDLGMVARGMERLRQGKEGGA